ncbi:hypothetical protein PG997_008688 [Apiospora hydei]|uniref:2EXR domain-containing protein n=1 Tax=Apiospora hydei TaxID=1337664 RepID=A0ABR1WEH9_9PEZI
MPSPSTFSPFPRLPKELQIQILEDAIEEDNGDRVVALTYQTGHVILTQELLNNISKFFSVCKLSRDVAESMYNVKIPTKNNKRGVVHLSTKMDIFFISPWAFTLGININANGGALFPRSDTQLGLATLRKMKHIMEHRVNLGGPIASARRPLFNRSLFRSAKVCYFQVDRQRPMTQSLAAQTGHGPYTTMDLLTHYMKPKLYVELRVPEDCEVFAALP